MIITIAISMETGLPVHVLYLGQIPFGKVMMYAFNNKNIYMYIYWDK